jgi:choline dehydrogenase
VIVGGGSAGCVLAARLAEDRSRRVLLLEAGPAPDVLEIHVPAALSRLWRSEFDWNFSTVPQERAGNRRVYWPRGRALGGSSCINAMIYIRGNRLDYDTWRDDLGCDGWGYRDLLPYFIRAEANSRGASAYHGKDGPLAVSDLRYKSPQTRAFVAAAVSRGAEANDDFNGASQDGAGFYQVTQRGGQRCTAADAYLGTTPPNLTILTGALATGVVTENGRATGVAYSRDGRETTVRAEAEVILAAGAIGSPHLLMLSGIGPAADLRAAGVDPVLDNPAVGANLSDHPVVPLIWSTPGVRGLWERAGTPGLARWLLTHRGAPSSNVAEAGGFARSDSALPAPDLQWHVLPVSFKDEGLVDPAMRAMTILVTLVEVASRGRIALASADPRHKPLIDPGYLTDPAGHDLAALVAGMRIARDYAAAAPMAGICAGEFAPGPDAATDDQLRQYARESLSTLYHPVGTCAMSGKPDSGVVDTQLRVRGIEGLRVVDASVMPVVPRGNTNAPVIAIAERAADLIAGKTPLSPAEQITR